MDNDSMLGKIIKKELISNIDKSRDYDIYELHQHSAPVQFMDDAQTDELNSEIDRINEGYTARVEYIYNTEMQLITEYSEKERKEGIEEFLKNNPNDTGFNCNCGQINLDNIKLLKFKCEKYTAYAICNKCLKYLRSATFEDEI